MPFSDPSPGVEILPGRQFRVIGGFTYALPAGIEGLPQGFQVNIPEGFVCDLASVPRIFWPIFPPRATYAPAAIIHDRLYRDHQVGDRLISRLQADKVFLAARTELGVGLLTRRIIYWAVRLGGVATWG